MLTGSCHCGAVEIRRTHSGKADHVEISSRSMATSKANVSKTLMNEKLFDEYRIGIAPVIHGSGRNLFRDGSRPDRLQLLEVRPLSRGCLILRHKSNG